MGRVLLIVDNSPMLIERDDLLEVIAERRAPRAAGHGGVVILGGSAQMPGKLNALSFSQQYS